jgi:excisionase family DNA binding protein
MANDTMYTTTQVCEKLAISYPFLLKLIKEGKIAYILLSSTKIKRYRFTDQQLQEYLKANEVQVKS